VPHEPAPAGALPARAAFAASVGSAFRVDLGAGEAELRLIELRDRPSPPRSESFALLFHGPPAPILPQRTYSLSHPALGAFDLFLVPIGRDGERTQYEAVFNRLLDG
jgi:hypothetical protein